VNSTTLIRGSGGSCAAAGNSPASKASNPAAQVRDIALFMLLFGASSTPDSTYRSGSSGESK
jgi:hypothetical protein